MEDHYRDEPAPDYNLPNEPVPSYESSQYLHFSSSVSRNGSTQRRYDLINGSAQGSSLNSSALSLTAPTPVPNTNSIESGFGLSTHFSSLASGNLLVTTSKAKNSLKRLGFRFLNARQHFALACCRDILLLPCIVGLFQLWRDLLFHENPHTVINGVRFELLTGARTSEHFLTGVWCIVSGYLSYSILDGLMVRWVVTYLTSAAIVRMLSMSTIMVTIEQYLVSTFSANGYSYGLHIWILISCCLTVTFIIQNFVTLNLDLSDGRRRARFFDFYTIAVFAVVPVGLASFITMVGLLRSLLILRLDIEHSLGRFS